MNNFEGLDSFIQYKISLKQFTLKYFIFFFSN